MHHFASTLIDSLLLMNEQAIKYKSDELNVSNKENNWRGLGFVVNGQQLVSVMNEITEIIDYPEFITTVPGTPSWMKGLTNIRGEVLPITDLQCFLGGTLVKADEQTKVLVIKNRGKYIGILVPCVLGIQYLPKFAKQKYKFLENQLDTFIYEIFHHENEVWPVVSMAALIAAPRFLMTRSFSDATETVN